MFVTSGVLPFGADGVIIRLPLTDFADRVYRDPDLSTLPIVRDERLYEDGNPPEKPDGSPVAKVEQARAAYLRGEGRRWQRIGGQLHDLERGPDGLLVRR